MLLRMSTVPTESKPLEVCTMLLLSVLWIRIRIWIRSDLHPFAEWIGIVSGSVFVSIKCENKLLFFLENANTGMLSKILKIMTPMTLMRKITQCKLEVPCRMVLQDPDLDWHQNGKWIRSGSASKRIRSTALVTAAMKNQTPQWSLLVLHGTG
jgi:hypothetical protein